MIVLLLALVAACGGGGGAPLPGSSSGGTTTTVVGNGTIKLALVDATGAVKTSTSTTAPITAKATVADNNGTLIKGALVTFTLDAPLATMNPTSGTALTDDKGVAQITLTGNAGGAGATQVTATAKIGTANITATSAFSILAPAVPVSLNGTIKVALSDASGAAMNLATSSSPLLVKATVNDDTGVPLANKLVTFTLSSTIALMSPSSGTALTDANGVAQVTLQSSGTTGAGLVTATTQVGTAPISASQAFSTGAAPSATPVAINFVSASPSDASIVIKGSGGNGRTEVALLTFKVVDSSNSGIANVAVQFSTSQSVTLAATSGTTDANGLVSVALNSGTTPTTVRVVATVAAQGLSGLSDQVTVTTGLPVQGALTLALTKLYVEGWSFANVQMTATVLMADANGGAVADGTAVVFTTDAGAIVGDGGAKCTTLKGLCSVVWRSQNPRPASGLATIVATSSNASATPLTVSQSFYLSGSYATIYGVSSGSFGATTRVAPQQLANVVASGIKTNCFGGSFAIEITDENGNPMPEGTTVTAINTRNVSVAIGPGTVNFSGLALGSATRGTIHTVSVTAPACSVVPAGPTATAYFDILVQSPSGGISSTRMQLGTFSTVLGTVTQ